MFGAKNPKKMLVLFSRQKVKLLKYETKLQSLGMFSSGAVGSDVRRLERIHKPEFVIET